MSFLIFIVLSLFSSKVSLIVFKKEKNPFQAPMRYSDLGLGRFNVSLKLVSSSFNSSPLGFLQEGANTSAGEKDDSKNKYSSRPKNCFFFHVLEFPRILWSRALLGQPTLRHMTIKILSKVATPDIAHPNFLSHQQQKNIH